MALLPAHRQQGALHRQRQIRVRQQLLDRLGREPLDRVGARATGRDCAPTGSAPPAGWPCAAVPAGCADAADRARPVPSWGRCSPPAAPPGAAASPANGHRSRHRCTSTRSTARSPPCWPGAPGSRRPSTRPPASTSCRSTPPPAPRWPPGTAPGRQIPAASLARRLRYTTWSCSSNRATTLLLECRSIPPYSFIVDSSLRVSGSGVST